jgi:hypothetical protein
MGFRLAVDTGGATAGRKALGEVWVEVVRIPRHVPQWVAWQGDRVRLFLHDQTPQEPGAASAEQFAGYLKGDA